MKNQLTSCSLNAAHALNQPSKEGPKANKIHRNLNKPRSGML